MSKVLLVEDDQFLSSILKNRLSKEGVEVVSARDGEEALSLLRQGTMPDLMLLDIILPKKSGFEVLQELRDDPSIKEPPVIIISNLGQPEDIARGKELGSVEYFVKAKTSIDDLISKIKSFLAPHAA